jgi:hypothetical protein
LERLNVDIIAKYVRRSNRVNFEAVNRIALACLPDLVRRWLPDGKRRNREWVAINPIRADRHAGSFSVNITTGRWADFATGDAGNDPVSLFAYINGIRQIDAARVLATAFGIREAA